MSLRSEVIRIVNELLGNSKKVSELPSASALTGTEQVEVNQAGTSARTTTQDIANLGGGGGGAVSSVFARTGAVTAQSGDYTGAQITNTPAGTIAATTTQAAINELDTEKEAVTNKATDFSTINDTLYPSVEAVEDRINSLISARITYSDLNLTGM